MLKFIVHAAVALLAVLSAGSSHAQISPAAAEQLMRQSGLWEQLASMAPQFRSGLEQGLQAPGMESLAPSRAEILAAADVAFVPDRLRASARRVFVESVRATFMADLQAWYQSPTAARISRAEEAATAAAQPTEAMAREGVALLQAAGPERRRLLLKMVEVSRAGPNNADMMIGTAVAVKNALDSFNPGPPAVSSQDAQATLQEQRPALVQAMENLSLASYAVMYKTTTDEDLSAYIDFSASAAGDHFADISQRAVEAALLEAFGAVAKPKR